MRTCWKKENLKLGIFILIIIYSSAEAENLSNLVRLHDQKTIDYICQHPIVIKKNNFVNRPWGGHRLLSYKGYSDENSIPYGESFEISAFDRDDEAKKHPSFVQFEDGSEMDLLSLLKIAGPKLLGESFFAQYGCEIPLLPKVLNIKQLLSMQAHQEGDTEVYIIIEAESGATMHVGFYQPIDKDRFMTDLSHARKLQEDFLNYLQPNIDQTKLYGLLKIFFSGKIHLFQLMPEIKCFLVGESVVEVYDILRCLKTYYQYFLRLMNSLPVKAGDIIYNSNPRRVLVNDQLPSAEVHALGNSDDKEILALEIRKPGPTFRLWDNVRFPLRPLEINRAISTLNLEATEQEDFFVWPQPTSSSGIFRSIKNDDFIIEHIRPTNEVCPRIETNGIFHMLHLIKGRAELVFCDQTMQLARGQTILIPAQISSYKVTNTGKESVELIKICIPTD